MTDPCPTCDGALHTERYLEHADAWIIDPCPRCLSLPASGELQAFARKGGFSGHAWRWHLGDGIGEARVRVIPFYLDAGMDLGARLLAGGEAALFYLDEVAHVWVLRPRVLKRRVYYSPRPPPLDGWLGGGPAEEFHVPALATIPKDAPANLQAARALRLCHEATDAG